MYNREVENGIEALRLEMRRKLPIPVLVKMSELRKDLEQRSRDLEDMQNTLVDQHKEYEHPEKGLIKAAIGPDHPNFLEVRNRIDELLSREFEPVHILKLYVRENPDGESEFCWTESFKTARFTEFEGDSFYGLLPMIEIVNI